MEQLPLELLEVSKKMALQAAVFKAGSGIAYANCFAAALAMEFPHAEIITGDKEFRKLEKFVKIRWI